MNETAPAPKAIFITRSERFGVVDWIIGGVLFTVAFALLWIWEFPGVLPSLWDEAAVGFGMRPAATLLPGYWRAVSRLISHVFGYHYGPAALRLLGHVSVALLVVGAYAITREMFAFIMRARPQRSRARSTVARISAIVASFAYLCADPVWIAGQCLSEDTILLLLTLGSATLFFTFLRKGKLKYAYFCAILLGLLAAETPVGLILLATFVALNFFILRVMPLADSPFYNPALIAVGKWYMTFLFIGAFAFGIVFNIVTFALADGMAATGQSLGHLPIAYLLVYWKRLMSSTGMLGWLLLVTVGITPFLVICFRFPAAADEDRFLVYATGLVFLACGVVAALQSFPISALWFWTYGAVKSGYLLSLALVFDALTLGGAIFILGIDFLCRNHKRLALILNSSDEDDLSGFKTSKSAMAFRWVLFVLVAVILIGAMLQGRSKVQTRAMLTLINDVIKETIRETDGASYLFTDGNLDAAVEIESARQGRQLLCLSLVGRPTPYDVYLRTRGLYSDAEDMMSFRHDCGMGLRTWMRDKPARLEKSAVQLGFDLWKRDGRAIPPMGGVLSLPTGWKDDRIRLEGIARTRQLIDRALALCDAGAVRKCTIPSIREAFAAVLWRLARFCTYRAERADLAGDARTAVLETSLAKRLNGGNEVFQRISSFSARMTETLLQRLTPREGLQLALVRGDFTMARNYAEAILTNEPQHSDANFALGMFYAQKARQFSRAEEYLKRALIKSPRQPAIYNNLAMVQMELGKLDSALINVDKALQMLPESAIVRDTKKQILAARDKMSHK